MSSASNTIVIFYLLFILKTERHRILYHLFTHYTITHCYTKQTISNIIRKTYSFIISRTFLDVNNKMVNIFAISAAQTIHYKSITIFNIFQKKDSAVEFLYCVSLIYLKNFTDSICVFVFVFYNFML